MAQQMSGSMRCCPGAGRAARPGSRRHAPLPRLQGPANPCLAAKHDTKTRLAGGGKVLQVGRLRGALLLHRGNQRGALPLHRLPGGLDGAVELREGARGAGASPLSGPKCKGRPRRAAGMHPSRAKLSRQLPTPSRRPVHPQAPWRPRRPAQRCPCRRPGAGRARPGRTRGSRPPPPCPAAAPAHRPWSCAQGR